MISVRYSTSWFSSAAFSWSWIGPSRSLSTAFSWSWTGPSWSSSTALYIPTSTALPTSSYRLIPRLCLLGRGLLVCQSILHGSSFWISTEQDFNLSSFLTKLSIFLEPLMLEKWLTPQKKAFYKSVLYLRHYDLDTWGSENLSIFEGGGQILVCLNESYIRFDLQNLTNYWYSYHEVRKNRIIQPSIRSTSIPCCENKKSQWWRNRCILVFHTHVNDDTS